MAHMIEGWLFANGVICWVFYQRRIIACKEVLVLTLLAWRYTLR